MEFFGDRGVWAKPWRAASPDDEADERISLAAMAARDEDIFMENSNCPPRLRQGIFLRMTG